MARFVDAFSIEWSQFFFYAFPPVCLIPRCVQKIIHDKASGILVIPRWTTQPFFTVVLSLLTDMPLILKASAQNLVHPALSSPHPLHQRPVGVQIIRQSLQRPIKKPSSETLLRLAELVLTLNCFSFGDNYYKQINGVAMGTKMGPSYANLFVGFIENKFFSNYHGPKSDLYKRYIDDCVSATSSSKEELNLFINAVNSFHPALKYTWEISENSLAFLDIKLSINDNGLSTSVHYKPTDSHNYLQHSSSHPQNVKNAIPFSQFLRLRRLCSDDTDFSNKCEEMCQFFKKRGYPDSAVTTGKHRAQEIDRETALQTSQNEETDRMPFTLTYHPQNLAIKNVILKNFKILRNDPETKHIFSLP